jgi:hypothetical protein
MELGLISGATSALILFAAGAGLSVLTCLLSYVTNQCLSSYLRNGKQTPRFLRYAKCTNRLGLVASISSISAFFVGVVAIWQNVSDWVL